MFEDMFKFANFTFQIDTALMRIPYEKYFQMNTNKLSIKPVVFFSCFYIIEHFEG